MYRFDVRLTYIELSLLPIQRSPSLHQVRSEKSRHDLAGLADEEPSFQKHERASLEPDDLRLRIHVDADTGKNLRDLFAAHLQVLDILVDQIQVVHVPAISFDVEPLLDVMIQAVRIEYRGYLRELTSESESDVAIAIREVPDHRECLCVHEAGIFR